jgi:hypothetical protein
LSGSENAQYSHLQSGAAGYKKGSKLLLGNKKTVSNSDKGSTTVDDYYEYDLNGFALRGAD